MSVHFPPWLYIELLKPLNFILIFNADLLNLAFHTNADSEPAFKINADPNPQPCYWQDKIYLRCKQPRVLCTGGSQVHNPDISPLRSSISDEDKRKMTLRHEPQEYTNISSMCKTEGWFLEQWNLISLEEVKLHDGTGYLEVPYRMHLIYADMEHWH